MWTIGYTLNYLSFGALLLLIYGYRGVVSRSLPYQLIARLGFYSYGIYLWHLSVREPIAKIVHHHCPASWEWFALLFLQWPRASRLAC